MKKRKKYGTILVDIETHRVIDILESRELEAVTVWLKTFPNIEVISRDGSITYRNAASLAHPNAIQVSDRFHLLKNLTDYCGASIKRILPSRVAIEVEMELSATKVVVDTEENIQINRLLTLKEKYKKCVKLTNEGKSQTEICNDLNMDCRVYKKLMQLSKKEIDEYFSTVTDAKQSLTLLNKLEKVNLVKDLHKKGHSNRKISKLTGFSKVTVGRYLDKDFSPVRKEGARDRISILNPYLPEIEEKLLQGIMASKIEIDIRKKGYEGSSSNFRHYCSNWKKTLAKNKETKIQSEEDTAGRTIEYILRQNILKLLYWPINKIPSISERQYELLRGQYPVLEAIIDLLNEFRNMFKEQSVDKLSHWIGKVEQSEIKELHSFINGLKRDIAAISNAIIYPYNNGLAEGSVNKLKVIKRIMYGRCSFRLLKSKLLRLEKMRKIN